MQYRTQANEMLDEICYRHYGASGGYLESVLEANPNLAEQPALLPADILIVLPELAEQAIQNNAIRLWD